MAEVQKKQSNTVSYILAAVIVALIGANIWWMIARDGVQKFAEGEPAPNFSLPLMNPLPGMGGEIELSELKGKVVLLDFWATWCSNCVREFPRIERLHREADKDNFVVLTVNNEQVAPDEARDLVNAFLDEHNYTVPVVLDNGSVFNAYRVDAIPRLVLLDRAGNVAKVFKQPVSTAQLQKEIQELL